MTSNANLDAGPFPFFSVEWVKLLPHQSLCCTVTTWWLESDGVVTTGVYGDWAANGSVVPVLLGAGT